MNKFKIIVIILGLLFSFPSFAKTDYAIVSSSEIDYFYSQVQCQLNKGYTFRSPLQVIMVQSNGNGNYVLYVQDFIRETK